MKEQAVTLHGYVSGRVQGVFFRAETRRKALELGLKGWVRNVIDGRVEVVISGSESATNAMREWLTKGPSLARVELLQLEPVDVDLEAGFQILD